MLSNVVQIHWYSIQNHCLNLGFVTQGGQNLAYNILWKRNYQKTVSLTQAMLKLVHLCSDEQGNGFLLFLMLVYDKEKIRQYGLRHLKSGFKFRTE